jgi:hypothetical protein
MKTTLIILFSLLIPNIAFSDQFINVNPPTVIVETPQVIIPAPPPRPLIKSFEWILTPQVSSVYVTEVRTGLFGRQYIVQKPQLVTQWVWVQIEVWK